MSARLFFVTKLFKFLHFSPLTLSLSRLSPSGVGRSDSIKILPHARLSASLWKMKKELKLKMKKSLPPLKSAQRHL